MFKSIRWKLISLYFILVFVAMAIVGLFITQQLENYNLSTVKRTLSDVSNNLINQSIKARINVIEQRFDIQRILDTATLPQGYEISVIDLSTGTIVASTNTNLFDKQGMDVFSVEMMLETSENNVIDKIIVEEGPYKTRYQHMAFTYDDGSEKNTGYIIYSRASLEAIDESLSHAKGIFLNATFIALAVTIVLGYAIAISITVPINDLRNKALKMSQGDFSQRVQIQSHDEIGQLASAFNFLTERLNETLIEISSEQNKLNAIIEHMDDALIAIDEVGKIIHYNSSAEVLLNLSVGSKEYVQEIFPLENNELTPEEIMSDTQGSTNKLPVITVNNKALKLSSAFFSDDKKILKGYVILFQDITEREHLDNMRKEFVANVSHELKTPITTIKSYSETLLNGALEEPALAKSFLNVMVKEADRMTSLIRDLLQLSHIDFNKMTWNFEYTDIHSLLNDAIEKMKLFYEEKHQIIHLEAPANLFLIWADRSKLEQVIINILSNAIKYTSESGTVDISLKLVDNMVFISIQDTGMGIPEEDLPHIFERFYRVDKGRSREQGGTGLGLSIAKNIIEAHKGTIEVVSKLHQGTCFTISLPVHKSEM